MFVQSEVQLVNHQILHKNFDWARFQKYKTLTLPWSVNYIPLTATHEKVSVQHESEK